MTPEQKTDKPVVFTDCTFFRAHKTPEETLKAVISKAEKGGMKEFCYMANLTRCSVKGGKPFYTTATLEEVIFDHNFAKCFWGVGKCECGIDNYLDEHLHDCRHLAGDKIFTPLWVFHLQQLALSEDRLGYLAKYLDEDE